MDKEGSATQLGMLPGASEAEGEPGRTAGAGAGEDAEGREPRLKRVNRKQMLLRAVNVEQLIPDDHPARAIWELVGRLDRTPFYQEIEAVEGVAGRPALDPQLLISLWIYAYSEGVSSAREISRLCEFDPAYQWLTGLEAINHHTLSDFRVDHQEALDELFTQVLGLLSAEGLITLQRVMHDGTKVKACAGGDTFRREEKLRAHLEMARQQVAQMGDPRSEELSRRVAKARERAAREKQQRLELAQEELEKLRATKTSQGAKQEARVSETDPEARIMKQADGGFAPSYNVQISTDATHGMIVGVEVSQSGTDYGQLVGAVKKVEENFGRAPEQVVVDGGFTGRENILAMDGKRVDLIGSLGDGAAQSACQMERRGVDPAFHPRPLLIISRATRTAVRPARRWCRREKKNASASFTTNTGPRQPLARSADGNRSVARRRPCRDVRLCARKRLPPSPPFGPRCKPSKRNRSIGKGEPWQNSRTPGSRPKWGYGNFTCEAC